jgi:HD-GYP domain-containing protein (c-di-GMP phosphodiesterase class II)
MTDKVHYLIVSKRASLRELVRFVLEWKFECLVQTCENESEALEYLRDIQIFPHMIIYDYEPDSFLVEDFIVYVKQSHKPIHFLVLADKISDSIFPHFEQLKHFHLIKKDTMWQEVIDLSQSSFKHVIEMNHQNLCRIHMKTLDSINGLNQHLSMKLPSGKMIQLSNTGQSEESSRQKYVEKGLDYLWLERSTCDWAIKQIIKQFHIFIQNKNFKFILRGPEASREERFEQNIIRIYDELHIDPDFRQEITVLTNKVLDVVQKDIKLSKLIQMIHDQKPDVSYFAKHLQMMSIISCSLAKKMEWNSKSTLEKLVYASVLHDVTLATKPHLQQINGLQQFEEMKTQLSPEDQKLYLNHPREAAGIVKNHFKMAPSETDVLILQHHELPHKKGFPTGSAAEKLSPLSQLFIITNDFVHYVMNENDPQLEMYFLRAEARFEHNVFRRFISLLKKFKTKS